MPVSWEQAAATAYIGNGPHTFAWSSCNRFIAVTKHKSVEVLDAVTLSSLGAFEYFGHHCGLLCFSPDSRCLTQFVDYRICSWDLQTGAPHGVISGEWGLSHVFSFTYSNDGKVIAVAYKGVGDEGNSIVFDNSFSTYDLHSRTLVGAHRAPEGEIIYPIWTHDEHFRFATVTRDSIRIWQSKFDLKHPSVEVESFPVPEEITHTINFLFLPARSRLVFILRGSIRIWDVRASKLLLKLEFKQRISSSMSSPPTCSFSSDGRFFAFAATAGEVYVWKESPTGYVFHQQLSFLTDISRPQFSPNGKSIIVSLPSMLHRWRTRDQVLTLPSTSTRDTLKYPFTLGFSPNEKFAVFARQNRKMVTVFDLQSGERRWIIDMGVEIDCLGMTEDTVVVFGEEKVAIWNLPDGDCTFHTSVNDSIPLRTSEDLPRYTILGNPADITISPDLNNIVVARSVLPMLGQCTLEVYDIPTRRRTARIETTNLMTLLFTQDGHEVWAESDGSFREQSKIIKDSKSGTIKLNTKTTEGPARVIFRESSHGHNVTDGWWVLSPARKHLLWLPHYWRSHGGNRKWGGRFLGLLHRDLPEVVILEFFE